MSNYYARKDKFQLTTAPRNMLFATHIIHVVQQLCILQNITEWWLLVITLFDTKYIKEMPTQDKQHDFAHKEV